MIDKKKMAAVTVLYNPVDVMLQNIRHYQGDVDVVYVVDNSDSYSPALEAKLRVFGNVTNISMGGNFGIARALNIAAEKALEAGYQYLLTMDQDSKVQPGMIQTMLDCVEGTDHGRIGIISPAHLYAYSQRWARPKKPCEEVLTAMTSGNLLNLDVYRAVGPFREDFFIDHVDEEYCLRLRLNGFKVIRANTARLDHAIGAITEHRFFFINFAVGNHSPIRRYYGVRNNFYLKKMYKRHVPEYFRLFYGKILLEIATILLYEQDKLKKLSMMMQGYRDYRRGKTGKYDGRKEP